MENPSIIITIIFSLLLPGAGHVYLGLKNRGFQLIIFYITLKVLNYLININLLDLASLLLFIYVFVEAIKYNKSILRGNPVEDIPIINSEFLNPTPKAIGIFLIVVGVLYGFKNVIDLPIFYQVREMINMLISNIAFPILLILVGIYIIYKNSKQ